MFLGRQTSSFHLQSSLPFCSLRTYKFKSVCNAKLEKYSVVSECKRDTHINNVLKKTVHKAWSVFFTASSRIYWINLSFSSHQQSQLREAVLFPSIGKGLPPNEVPSPLRTRVPSTCSKVKHLLVPLHWSSYSHYVWLGLVLPSGKKWKYKLIC